MRPVAVDLFAGAGGMSLGFEQAGFDVAAAVEIDPVHACVHAFNFPGCTVIPRSVRELTGRSIRNASGLDGRIDVVCGGAPCQGFSLIGQRALDDPRNHLVKEFVRLVRELEPSYFVFENVKGLTVGAHRSFLNELIEAFAVSGYWVLLPWRVLNAVDHGVPQDRQRLFLIGARKGLALPEYPRPQFHRVDGHPEMGAISGPSCQDALGDVPDADLFEELLESDSVFIGVDGARCSKFAGELRCAGDAAWHAGHRRLWNPALLTSSARTLHTEISRRRFAETPPGCVEPISRFFKLSAGGVSNTLRAGTDAARGAFTSPRPIHYAHPRCVTVREMARLHGFPDWFRFHATKWHGARQIGNAVPPPLARAVATVVREAIGTAPTRPKSELPLGDPDWLAFDISEAARHLGVPSPDGKRDRKSGARKRSQAETEAWRLAHAKT